MYCGIFCLGKKKIMLSCIAYIITDSPYILSNLIPRAKYQFSVAARNVVGDGPWKTADYIMPEETVPEPPKIKTRDESLSEYPDRFEVRWEIPNDNGKPIQKYGIRYFRVSIINVTLSRYSCLETSFIVIRLKIPVIRIHYLCTIIQLLVYG